MITKYILTMLIVLMGAPITVARASTPVITPTNPQNLITTDVPSEYDDDEEYEGRFADDGYFSIENITDIPVSETPCATAIYTQKLQQVLGEVQPDTPDDMLERSIELIFSDGPTLRRVLECPEVANHEDEEAIRFQTITAKFPGSSRTISVNYETQPKVIKQRIRIAEKRALPIGDPSPRLGEDGALWVNTDPAWYGVMVVEAGTMDKFVGPDKNNTISLRYIKKHIDDFFPQGWCTGDSAWTFDSNMLNKVMSEDTVAIENDKSDYYVAGDVHMEWVGYMQMAADVVLTAVSFGGWAALTGFLKGFRAGRAALRLTRQLRVLTRTSKVMSYVKLEKHLGRLKDLEKLAKGKKVQRYNQLMRLDPKDLVKYEKELAQLKNNKNVAAYVRLKEQTDVARTNLLTNLENELKQLRQMDRTNLTPKQIKQMDKYIPRMEKELDDVKDVIRGAKDVDIAKEQKSLGKLMSSLEKEKEVGDYKKSTQALRELNQYRRGLRAAQLPVRGNVFVRSAKRVAGGWKSLRAANNGNRIIKNATKAVRHSTFSGAARSWLFQTSLRNAGLLTQMAEKTSMMYAVLKVAGGMWDLTESSTGDFTNNIDFQPLLLLSADDIPGQEDVVNYGMWLMWYGDSYSEADDDAAYLQALDLANKMVEDINARQEKENWYPCNIDVYVVRPIIRNPGTSSAEIYYLVMNDVAFSTARN